MNRNTAMSELKIIYQEESINNVFRYFAKGFKTDAEVVDWFIDPVKETIIFKFYVREKTNDKSHP